IREAAAKTDQRILVWIHDYQLLLAPAMLRRMLKSDLRNRVRIGFFLHIPFPPVSEFQMIDEQKRRLLLNGVLGADVIGFHTRQYLTNFSHALEVSGPARGKTELVVQPIGINPDSMVAVLENPRTQGMIRGLTRFYNGYDILFGAERLDPAKGILE